MLNGFECWTFRDELIAVDGKASGHDRPNVRTLHLLTGTGGIPRMMSSDSPSPIRDLKP